MLRQQRSQRQPSRFQDFVDLPPQKRIRRAGETPPSPPAQRTAHRHQKATGCHSSSPKRPTARPTTTAEKRAIAPKVQHSEQDVHEIATTDFFLQSAAAGGVLVEYVCPVVEYVCPEELLALSAAERIDFLQDKLHRIRTYYASLKSEVESIDRRRKKMKRKKRRRDGSTTPASASVSSGSSPSMDTASSPSTDTLVI